MPARGGPELLADLVSQKYPISVEAWGDFWDRLAAREPVLITRAPSDAPTKAEAVERLNVLDPPPVPTMFTVGRAGGSG